MTERDLHQTRTALTRWLEAAIPAADVVVEDLELPAAGASNETILFSASWTADGERHDEELVLRVQPVAYQLFPNGDVFHQWRTMEAISAQPGVPVPPLRWKEPSADVLGAPFYVMARVEGQVPNGFQSTLMVESTPAQRGAMYRSGLEMLARVHQLDWRHGFDFMSAEHPAQGLPTYLETVGRWYEWARAGRRFELIERALRHLQDTRPHDAPVSLLWGDSRPGNLMFSPEDQRVTAVLDWELADVATPEADLAWWVMFERLFSSQIPDGPPQGVPSREESFAHYERALGRPLGDMTYFDVLAWTRLALTFIRHVDLERGGPREQVFDDFASFVDVQLADALAVR
jgi:aminoglycoside phosphotransferase (APT) family kinase protein